MKKTLTIAVVLFVAYATAAFYFSGEITTFKVKSKETVLAEDNLRGYADVDLPRPEDVSVTGGQVELNGWLFVNRKNRRCGVILHHGHAADRNGMLKYAKLFWPRGCHLLMFDARHHGQSAGTFATWGVRERDDLVIVADWFAKRTGLPHEKIGLFGASMGAAIVLQAAPLTPDLAFVAADSPFRDLDTILKYRGSILYGKAPILALYPAASWIAGLRGNFRTEEASPLSAAPHIEIPVFMTHVKDDDAIPFTHSEEVFAAIGHNRKTLHLVDKGGHCGLIKTNPTLYAAWMDDFLKKFAPEF